MFSGESEAQARRKTLAVLLDEVRRVLDSARELNSLYIAVMAGKSKDIQTSMSKIRKAEDDVETYRRALTRELAELGTMLMNREDLLRTAYDIEEIAGYCSGIAFRFSILKSEVLKKGKVSKEFAELLNMAVELVHRLNEMVRALSVNPATSLEIANKIQQIEKETDDKFRTLVPLVFKQVKSLKDAVILKDIAERVEEMADRCLRASDSITIVALGL